MLRNLRAAAGYRAQHSAIYLSIASNLSNINLFSLFGSPVAAGNYIATIESGVLINSSSASTAALISGNFPNGSTLKLINNGQVIGAGGAGGVGGNPDIAGNPGNPGGNSIDTTIDLTIDNIGDIFAGGGGGGGGGGDIGGIIYCDAASDGSGGGGGAGNTGGAGAAAGNGASNDTSYPGSAGGTTGGAGGATPTGVAGSQGGGAAGGAGGAGGEYGAVGVTGVTGNDDGSGCATPKVGGTGGAGGNAVKLNGNIITWVSGNNSTQVKGTVA